MVHVIDWRDRPRVIALAKTALHQRGYDGQKCRSCKQPYPCKVAAQACDSFINVPAPGAVA